MQTQVGTYFPQIPSTKDDAWHTVNPQRFGGLKYLIELFSPLDVNYFEDFKKTVGYFAALFIVINKYEFYFFNHMVHWH